MRILGSVAAILDARRILIKIEGTDVHIRNDQVLTVFAAISEPKLGELGLAKLYVPKGELKVVLQQDPGYYLAERFKQPQTNVKRVRKPTLNPFADVLGAWEEVEVPGVGGWSAQIDSGQSLNIQVAEQIQVGDLVGEK